MPGHRTHLPITLWVCWALLAPARLAGKVQAYFSSAARSLDPRPRAALGSIPNRARRMLAVTQYLRRRHLVDTLWTWSPEETRAHQ